MLQGVDYLSFLLISFVFLFHTVVPCRRFMQLRSEYVVGKEGKEVCYHALPYDDVEGVAHAEFPLYGRYGGYTRRINEAEDKEGGG